MKPNNFLLKGQNIQIEYETTSLSGEPLLTGQYKGKDTNFREGQITLEEIIIGQMVSVVLKSEPDKATITLTLLIPRINLEGNDSSSTFQTEAIITEHLTSVGGPGLINGPVQKYRFDSLGGTASFLFS